MVRRWSEEPHGKEGQVLTWQNPQQLTVMPLLPANAPILKALSLPTTYAITNLAETPEALFFQQLKAALDGGLRMIQIREKQLDLSKLRVFAEDVMKIGRPYGAKIFMNSHADLVHEIGADGVHLTAKQLMQQQARPNHPWLGASCHNEVELAHAKMLGLDYVTLSPVLSTRSHPETIGMGWAKFQQMITDYPLPVFALGGMRSEYLELAWQHGAHGIAMQREVWKA